MNRTNFEWPILQFEMKKILSIKKHIWGFLIVTFLIQSCTEEIDMFDPQESVPVVYALLDPDYSTQYIRVGQSFIYKGQDSILNLPKLTYLEEDFDLYVTYFDASGSNKIVWFEPHNGPLRDSGMFAQEELQIFSADLEIQNSIKYKLYLHFKESGKIVYGELTSFDHDFVVIDPLDVAFRTVNIYSGEDFYFRFKPVAKRAVYQAFLTFNYEEVLSGVPMLCSLEFPLEIVFGDENDVLFVTKRFSGETFLRDIGQRIEPREGVSRRPIGLDFFMSAGGEELYYLIKASNDQFGYLAMSNTNLDNGIGIFSTLSHKTVNNIPLSEHSIDSLALSQFTKHLGFQPFSKQVR